MIDFLIETVEYVLFSNYPFYQAYIQEYGFVKSILRLNPIIHIK